jgi:glycolate oxidase
MNKKEVKKLREELTAVMGNGSIETDPDILETYSRDETADAVFMPDILVRAENSEEVSTVLRICNEMGVPVVPRGAGSGVTGGALPVHGGLVLSLEKMNRILEIDTENMVAVVEPGVITGELQKAVLQEGLLYPPDPASLDICSIGGNVAENAGGPRAVKYGTTKEYILGLEFVTPDGTIMNTGGKIVKDVTGYNLAGIIIGSEGTLAVVTKIYLKLIPAPSVTKDLLVPFDSVDDAINAVYRILTARITPATLEFMEEDGIKLVAKFHGGKIPFPEAGAHLLIQINGESEESVYHSLERIWEVIDVDPEKIFAAESEMQRERLWKARRAIREAIHEEDPCFLAEDCVVPRSRIPDFIRDLKEYFNSVNLKSIMFGHAGDGNVHIDILKGDREYKQWKGMQPDIKKEVYTRAIQYGGTITGEHGVGMLRKDYLTIKLSQEEIELMKRIKDAFDPKGILNPGKIFSDE